MICDFCSSPDVQWDYIAKGFTGAVVGANTSFTDTKVIEYASDPGWIACDLCKQIIERGDREALVEISLVSHESTHGVLPDGHRPKMRRILREFHRVFWESHSEPMPLTAREKGKSDG